MLSEGQGLNIDFNNDQLLDATVKLIGISYSEATLQFTKP
jgi:hypothetical protein